MLEKEKLKKLSKTELKFMKVIWENPNGIASKDIYEKFNQARGTKSTILHNIIQKGYVNTMKDGLHVIYTPKVLKEEYEDMIMSQAVNKLENIISAFFNKKKLSDDEIERAKKFLEGMRDDE